MPWNESHPVEERAKFVLSHQAGAYTMAELCRRYGVSRRTGYKWVARYAAEGLAGLEDHSHAPQHCPHRLDAALRSRLLACREAHPRWGPRKVLDYLRAREPNAAWPAASTVGDLFQRAGLVRPRRRRRRAPVHQGRLLEANAPNEVWTADYKGEFRLGDGTLCYPLTVADAATRYLLGCEVKRSTSGAGAQKLFEQLFRTYGLPDAIRTDNGTPFASTGRGGLTQLSVWWIELGIVRERIRPASPQENGAHERMHRTLAEEVTRPPGRDAREQQAKQDHFRTEYNQERPHEALGGQTPAARYRRSERAMPERTPTPEYAGHWEVRRVRRKGTIRFKGREIFVSGPLAGKRIALDETDDGVWSLYFHDVLLAKLDEREFRLYE